jgi:hypothetical protein
MNEKQMILLEQIKIEIKELMAISSSSNPDLTMFEIKYKKLKETLLSFIEHEENEVVKAQYEWKYKLIVAFETKPKGIDLVQLYYDKSIKPKASIKSKREFESSLRDAANHIEHDFKIFLLTIPIDSNTTQQDTYEI